MKAAIVLGTMTAMLSLAGCNNDPDQASDAASSDVETISLDDETSAESVGETGDNAGETSQDRSDQSDDGNNGTMISGSNDPSVTAPPKGSKLQPAD